MSIRLTSPGRFVSSDRPSQRVITRARNFFKSSAGRILLGTTVCWVAAYFFCTQWFWRDPHSSFFDPPKAYEMHYTLHRQAEASQLIDAAEADWSLAPYQSSPEPAICAGVVTVKRKGIQYLNGTVGSLLAGLTPEERSAVNVQVLFADIEPSVHPDWDRPWLKLVDSWSRYAVSNETLAQLLEWKQTKKIRAKAIHDYTYLLDKCLNETNAPFIAIFEDDIIFADGWLSETMSALAQVRQKRTPWLYLRLFYTDKMLGWDKDWDEWYTNPIFRFFFAMGFVYVGAIAARIYCKRKRPDIDATSLVIVTCLTIPAFVGLIYMIGQYSLVPQYGVQRMDTKGCCTQALVFPRSQVTGMANALLNQKPDQTDLLMEEWANQVGLARYAITPQVVQHVGLISSRGTKKKHSQNNWAFWFEANDPKRLAKQHGRISQWAIWRATEETVP